MDYQNYIDALNESRNFYPESLRENLPVPVQESMLTNKYSLEAYTVFKTYNNAKIYVEFTGTDPHSGTPVSTSAYKGKIIRVIEDSSSSSNGVYHVIPSTDTLSGLTLKKLANFDDAFYKNTKGGVVVDNTEHEIYSDASILKLSESITSTHNLGGIYEGEIIDSSSSLQEVLYKLLTKEWCTVTIESDSSTDASLYLSGIREISGPDYEYSPSSTLEKIILKCGKNKPLSIKASPVTSSDDTQYGFKEWTYLDSSAGHISSLNPLRFNNISSNINVTVKYKKEKINVTVTTNDRSAGKIYCNGVEVIPGQPLPVNFKPGDALAFSTSPDTSHGYSFRNYIVDGSVEGRSERKDECFIIYPVSDTSVMVNFDTSRGRAYTLTTNNMPASYGTVTVKVNDVSVSGNPITCYDGDDIELLAHPASGIRFMKWDLDRGQSETVKRDYTQNPIKIIDINKDYNVTAIYDENGFNVTVNITPAGKGHIIFNGSTISSSCVVPHVYGNTQIKAVPGENMMFDHWVIDSSVITDIEYTLNVLSDTSIGVVFKDKPVLKCVLIGNSNTSTLDYNNVLEMSSDSSAYTFELLAGDSSIIEDNINWSTDKIRALLLLPKEYSHTAYGDAQSLRLVSDTSVPYAGKEIRYSENNSTIYKVTAYPNNLSPYTYATISKIEYKKNN